MNDIVTKLNKIDIIKQDIRQQIIQKGVAVSLSEPFINYSEKIKQIQQNLSIDNLRIIKTQSNPVTGGTTKGDGYASDNMRIEISAEAKVPYSFSYWSLDGKTISTENPFISEVTKDSTFIANYQERISIPSDYTQVQYIYNPNKTSLDTSALKGRINDYIIEIDFTILPETEAGYIFGVKFINGRTKPTGTFGFTLYYGESTSQGKYISFDIEDSCNLPSGSNNEFIYYNNLEDSLINKKSKIIINGPEKYVDLNGEKKFFTLEMGSISNFYSEGMLFAYYKHYEDSGSSNTQVGSGGPIINIQMSSVKVLDSIAQEYTFYGIPCTRTSPTWEAGFYNVVNGQFYTRPIYPNETGTQAKFAAGPEVTI